MDYKRSESVEALERSLAESATMEVSGMSATDVCEHGSAVCEPCAYAAGFAKCREMVEEIAVQHAASMRQSQMPRILQAPKDVCEHHAMACDWLADKIRALEMPKEGK